MPGDVDVFFGKKKVSSPEDTTVGALLTLAGFSPTEYELELRKGEGGPIEKVFKDPNEKLDLKSGEHFSTKFIGPIQPSNRHD